MLAHVLSVADQVRMFEKVAEKPPSTILVIVTAAPEPYAANDKPENGSVSDAKDEPRLIKIVSPTFGGTASAAVNDANGAADVPAFPSSPATESTK